MKNISGQIFGYLTALERAFPKRDPRYRWKCKCKCGAVVTVDARHLRSGHTKSCGCFQIEELKKRLIISGKEAEISVAMSQAGGRAVAAFMSDPSRTAADDWECKLAALIYRMMRQAQRVEQQE